MQTSIATVSLSGGLAEKLEAIAAAGFTGVEIFESDLLSFNGTPKDVARMVASLGLKIVTFQPFRDFEGMPEPQREPHLRARRAQIRSDGRARLRPADDLQQRRARIRSAASTAPRRISTSSASARKSAASASASRRWPGASHISDYRDSWEVVRRADHPAVGLTLDSFHIFSRKTDLKAIRSIPRRQDRAGAARRRAVARHGRDQLEPALPLLPRPGRFPADRFHGCGVRHRLQRHAVAGNLQRPVPRRLAARRRRRWPALAASI